MKTFIPILLAMLPVLTPGAELLAPNDAGVSFGHLDTNVKDMEAAKKFWALLGGKATKVDGAEVMKFPGLVVFLRKGEVSGPTMGTSFDHAGFWVPNGKEFVERLKAAGVKTDPTAGTRNPNYHGYSWGNVYSPDGVKIEILENKNLTVPIESDHIHIYGSNQVSEVEMQAWYHKVFDARLILDPVPNATKPVVAILIGPEEVKFTKSAEPLTSSKGRAVERIGLEVKNLEAFCKRLETEGVKLDKPYSKSRHSGFASAEIVDPWGTPIELTEGLNKI